MDYYYGSYILGKRAESDYEITLHTCRKLIELENRLELLINAKFEAD